MIGTTSSHQEFLTGGLDDSGNCKVGQFHDTSSRKSLGYQVAQRLVEISLFNEQGLVNDVLGTVRLTDNIMAKVGDESVRDSVRGTYVWTHQRLTCPDTISQIYRGPMKFYVNSSDPNMEGGLTVLEKDD